MIPTTYNLSEALNSKVELLLQGFKLQLSYAEETVQINLVN